MYAGGDDMKEIAKGIYDPEKKKKAQEDIQQLQKYAKAAGTFSLCVRIVACVVFSQRRRLFLLSRHDQSQRAR